MGAWGRREFISGVGIITGAGAGSLLSVAATAGVVPRSVSPADDTSIASLIDNDASATSKSLIKRGAQPVRSVNVRDFGAVPVDQNGGEGANAGIQAAIDDIAGKGGGEVVVDDDYWIKCHVPGATGNSLLDQGGIAMKSGVHLRFTAGGVFRVIPTGESKYQCIRIYDKNRVRVSGPGRIIGDRAAHTPADTAHPGEWGYGVSIQGGSEIRIEDITVTEMWGDGIDVTFVYQGNTRVVPKNLTIRNVICDGNRRQGLSLEAGDWVLIEDSRFVNTGGAGGTLPMNGIDVEPSSDTTACSNVVIRRCWLQNNGRAGVADGGFGIGVYRLGTRDVTVDDCDFVSNLGAHQYVNNLSGPNVRLTNSRFVGTATNCAQVMGGEGRVLSGNTFDGRVRIAPDYNASANIARGVHIVRNRFVANSTTAVSGLVEVNEHVRQTEIVDNYFEQRGARGICVWIRTAGAIPPLQLQQVRIAGNTFINMTAAVYAGDVTAMVIENNIIHASGDSAIYLYRATSCIIRDNWITGSNLISGTAAVTLGGGSSGNQIDGNKIALDPAIEGVAETRRGTHAYRLTGGPTLDTVIRSTHLTGALSWYADLGTRTGTYLETTPGTFI
ncbi:right-handed parallel beta-helix repeat-containing protein [Microbacterium sp. NPDC089698]|uniref:right-handed parallel beta-helix repeat-containing protein n=1 Tax=Microbacterium sp. NPDC089698 TaxID=3364200 RepID=UPI00380A603A